MEFLYCFGSKSIKFLHFKSIRNSIEKMMNLLKTHVNQITENMVEIVLTFKNIKKNLSKFEKELKFITKQPNSFYEIEVSELMTLKIYGEAT